MPLRSDMDAREYLEVFLRRKWLIIFSALFILFAASVYCVVVPEQFKSSTMILVIPQRVPENYVRSTVSVRIEERLSTIRQQVLSRTRLGAVMEELGLYKKERTERPLEEVLEKMRQQIEIQVKGTDAFTLSFIHENPQMAMLTTSRLASFFIDENLKTREQQAVGTSEFLDSQLQETKKRLEVQEELVRQYKMRFMGELPQQMEANLSMLRGLQERLRTTADAIRGAEDRKIFVETQISSLERSLRRPSVQEETAGASDAVEAAAAGSPEEEELAAKTRQLAELSLRYTDQYPAVRTLRAEVEQLEARLSAAGSGAGSERRTTAPRHGGVQPAQPVSPAVQELQRLRTQLAGLQVEIASRKKEQVEIGKAIEAVEGKVDRSPKREQEMIALTRDYENLKLSYDDLLKKKLDADISQNLEKRQKGEQFQILDPANAPERPFRPDRRKVFGIAVFLALAVGFGGAIGLETFDQTLRTARDFRHHFDLPVLATVPVLQDHAYARKRAYRKAAVFGGIISFTAAVTIFLLAYGDRIRVILSF